MPPVPEALLEVAGQTVLRPLTTFALATVGARRVASVETTTTVAVLQERRLGVVAPMASSIPFAAQVLIRVPQGHELPRGAYADVATEGKERPDLSGVGAFGWEPTQKTKSCRRKAW